MTGAALLIMVFGLHFLGILRMPFLDREARLEAGDRGGSALGAYLLGLAFAFGWTPCLGPILGAILGLAASEARRDARHGAAGDLCSRARHPVPARRRLLPAAGTADGGMRRHMGAIERVSGLLLWTVGLLMLTGQFSDFSYWLLETFPGLALLG